MYLVCVYCTHQKFEGLRFIIGNTVNLSLHGKLKAIQNFQYCHWNYNIRTYIIIIIMPLCTVEWDSLSVLEFSYASWYQHVSIVYTTKNSENFCKLENDFKTIIMTAQKGLPCKIHAKIGNRKESIKKIWNTFLEKNKK